MIVSWILASGESFICVANPTRADKMKRPFALGCWHLLVSGSRVWERTAITLSIVSQSLERIAAHSPSLPPSLIPSRLSNLGRDLERLLNDLRTHLLLL